MKKIEITSEQARDYISRQQPDGFELPKNYNFDQVTNHLEASVVFAALTNQTVDLNLLYGGFYAKSPGILGVRHGYSKVQCREFARVLIKDAVKGAIYRDETEFHTDPIEALQYQLANEWKLDDVPSNIFTVGNDGETTVLDLTN